MGQSAADDPPLTPPPVDKDASLSVGAAQSGRVISPHVPTTPTSDRQPTPSGSLAAERERSESGALSLSPLDSVVGHVLADTQLNGVVQGSVCECVCVHMLC